MSKKTLWLKRGIAVFSLSIAVTGFGLFAAAPPALAQLTQAQVQSILSLLTSFGADQATIANVSVALQGGTPTTPGTGEKPNVPATFRFDRNLTVGSRGMDVMYLQRILNAYPETQISSSGAGSPGQETQYFGPLTRTATVRFQEQFSTSILLPLGLTRGTGFVGTSTRARLNSMISSNFPNIPGGQQPPVNGGQQPPVNQELSISAGTQPTASLAPAGAARVPFTRFTLAAGSQSVTVNNLTIARTGFVNNAAFDGIVLLDQSGLQVGTSRTLNANGQANFSESITIPAGTSRTFTIAANMNQNLDAYNGQIGGFSLISVGTSSGVAQTGSLPIEGARHTMNANLTIGNATVRTGTLGTTALTREIGTDNQTFASFILSAGSQEDMRIQSLRWNQSGSASASDLENVVTVINGVPYSAEASANGRYYTTTVPGSGILLQRGQSVEVSVRGDIVSGSGRTIVFDIDRPADIYLVGTEFGYGLTPIPTATASASDSSAQFTTGTPFYDAAVVTVSGASVVVSRSTDTPAQNVAIQVANQRLGGFLFDIQGESVTMQNTTFDVTVTRSGGSPASVDDITNVTLVRADTGAVIAGPVNAVGSGTSGTVTFSDSATLPQGETTLEVRGQLSADFQENDRIVFSLEPASDLSDITGDGSGNAVNATPSSTISANAVTVGPTDINVNVAATPASQTIVAGAQNLPMARLQFNLTGASENMRLSTLPVTLTHSGSPEILSNCRVYEVHEGSSMLLSSAGNAVTPSASLSSGGTLTFNLDSGTVLEAGEVATLEIRCNVSSSATSGETLQMGLGTEPTLFGVNSGRTINANIVGSTGPTMTIATEGSFSVNLSPSSPSFTVTSPIQNRTVTVLRFNATNEAVRLNQIGLELNGTTTPADLQSVTLWDGSAQVGTAFFGNDNYATTTLNNFVIPQFGEKELTIRANFNQIGTGQPATQGALIAIDYDGDNASTTRGIGVSSGSVVYSSTNTDTDAPGVKLYKTFPTVSLDSTPSSVLASGQQALMRFRVTADSNHALGLGKFTFNIGTSTANVTNVNVYAYTDASYASAVSGVGQNGQFDDTNKNPDANGMVEIYAENSNGDASPLQVPAGTTRYFEVRGIVSGATTGSAVTTSLQGDSSLPLTSLMGTFAEVDGAVQDDFIWSPNATTTSTVSHEDWTNGYGIPGLPANGLMHTLAR